MKKNTFILIIIAVSFSCCTGKKCPVGNCKLMQHGAPLELKEIYKAQEKYFAENGKYSAFLDALEMDDAL